MFLLNRSELIEELELDITLHPNMFLLNLTAAPLTPFFNIFTSQYVSIKSEQLQQVKEDFNALHPNMFLLNPRLHPDKYEEIYFTSQYVSIKSTLPHSS